MTSWQSGITVEILEEVRVDHGFGRRAVSRRDALLEMMSARGFGRQGCAEGGVVATQVLGQRVGHHFVHVDGDAQSPGRRRRGDRTGSS